MAEYINRGTAIAKLTFLEVTEPNATMADAKRVLADMSAADVAPVVHGRWIVKKEWRLGRWVKWLECSNCGEHEDNFDMYEMMPFCEPYDYCPNCGAKMDIK